jgi:FkbM family methyltransferase
MRIVFITPHLSTGGMPEYVRRSIELIDRKLHQVLLIEIRTEKFLDAIRKRVLDLEGIELFSAEKSYVKAIEKIESFDPHVIHFTEPSEQVIRPEFLGKIYKEDRTWKIFETCHDSSYPLSSKKFLPDKFLLVSPFQVEMLQDLGVPSELIQYDVPSMEEESSKETLIRRMGLDPNKKHVFQFGIFSPRKNQGETVEIAKHLVDEPIQFHFVGNTADSYSYYWDPILKNLPKNCKFWGEHKNVQQFYKIADLVVFPSVEYTDDKETNPLVIKESIKYGVSLLLKDTPVYLGMYPENNKVTHMKSSHAENAQTILSILSMKQKPNMINVNFDANDNNRLDVTSEQAIGKVMIAVKDVDSEVNVYGFSADFSAPNMTWWCRPIPRHCYDFQLNPNFSGFLVEVYAEDGITLLGKTELLLKERRVMKRKIPNLHSFDPLYVNYDQFYTQKIYDDFFLGERIYRMLDVGANVGIFTQWALDRFGADTQIVAVEPMKVATEVFKKIHAGKDNVQLQECAITGYDGELELGVDPENSLVSSIAINKSNVIKVPAMRLSSLMTKIGWDSADLLKMDIEGAEYEIFEEVTSLPFKNILLEFHYNGDGRLHKLLDKLETLGFEYDIRQEDTRFKAGAKDERGIIIAKKK